MSVRIKGTLWGGVIAMDVKKVALLVAALVIAVVTAVMAKNMFVGAGAAQAEAAPAVPLGPKILVARKALPVGTIIDQESLTYQAWPKEMVQNAYYVEGGPDGDISKLLGTVVRNPITAGQPVTRGSLVGPNDRGFLAAALGPGMRAVTVPVSATSGVAGFVFAGDRVDLVLTQEVTGGGDGPPLRVSETIVRNMRVLATDQRIDSKDEEGKTVVKTSPRDPRGHAAHRREDRRRAIDRPAVAVASLDRRKCGRARTRRRQRRSQGAGRHQPGGRAPDAARDRQPSDRQQHHLHHRCRRVALPAPQRPGPAESAGDSRASAPSTTSPAHPRRPRRGAVHAGTGGPRVARQ